MKSLLSIRFLAINLLFLTGLAPAQTVGVFQNGQPAPFKFRVDAVITPSHALDILGHPTSPDTNPDIITIVFHTRAGGVQQYATCDKSSGRLLHPDTCRVPEIGKAYDFHLFGEFGSDRDFAFWDNASCPSDVPRHSGVPDSRGCFVWAFHATAKVR